MSETARKILPRDQDSSVPRAYNVPGRYVPRKLFGSNDFLDGIGGFFPIGSMYGIFGYIWLISMVNVGK